MNKKSSLFKELTKQEIERITAAELSMLPQKYELMDGGLFNTTYSLFFDGGKRVILRVGPVNRHLLMPFEHHLMSAEAEVYSQCRAIGIPTSEVIACNTSKAIIDRDYMLVKYIPSVVLSDSRISSADRKAAMRAAGEYAARLHTVTAPRFGRVYDVKNGGGYDEWSEFFVSELENWYSVAQKYNVISADEYQCVMSLYKRARDIFDEVKTPCLVHTDIWSGNILVDKADNSRLAAIIDADRAIYADPLFEFAAIDSLNSDENFISGYGCPLPCDAKSQLRFSFYRLLVKLWNSYVYLAEYNDRECFEAERNAAMELLASLRTAVV